MKKPEKKKMNSVKIWSMVGVWLVLVGGGIFHVLHNGTLLGGFDSSVHTITVAELEAGKRPAGRHVRMEGARLDGLSIHLTTKTDNIDSHDYYYAVHDATKDTNGVVRIIIRSENAELPVEGAYTGQMSFPETGFVLEDWLAESFKNGEVEISDQMMWMKEGESQLGDLFYALIVLLVVFIVSTSITYGVFLDDYKQWKWEKKNPIPQIPIVTQEQSEIEKEVLNAAVQFAPEDKTEEINFWANWRDIREPVIGQWDKGGTTGPVPQPLLDALTKLEHYFYHKGEEDVDLLRFELYFSEEKDKWTVRKYY